MRFKQFLEDLEDPEKRAEIEKKILPIKTRPSDPNKSKSALALKDIMKRSKAIGHTPSVAHAVGVYPA